MHRLLLAAAHKSEAMLKADFRGQSTLIVHALQQGLLSKSAATVTLVHVYDGMLDIVRRTASHVVLLLCAECSAEQAPVLNIDSITTRCVK